LFELNDLDHHLDGRRRRVQPLDHLADVLHLRRRGPHDKRVRALVRFDRDRVRPTGCALGLRLEQGVELLRHTCCLGRLERENLELLGDARRCVQFPQQVHDHLVIVARGATDQTVRGFVRQNHDRRPRLVVALGSGIKQLLHPRRELCRRAVFQRIDLKNRRLRPGLQIETLVEIAEHDLEQVHAFRRAHHQQRVRQRIGLDTDVLPQQLTSDFAPVGQPFGERKDHRPLVVTTRIIAQHRLRKPLGKVLRNGVFKLNDPDHHLDHRRRGVQPLDDLADVFHLRRRGPYDQRVRALVSLDGDRVRPSGCAFGLRLEQGVELLRHARRLGRLEREDRKLLGDARRCIQFPQQIDDHLVIIA